MAESDEWEPHSGPDGKIVRFKKGTPQSEIDAAFKSKEYGTYIEGLKPYPEGTGGPGQDKTAGKIAPYTSERQMPPGIGRDMWLGGGQFIRGMVSPVAIPGDLNRAATYMSGGYIPQYNRLLTSEDLDKISTDLDITPLNVTPQNRFERDLAMAFRGAGEAVDYPLGGRALGTAIRPIAGQNALMGTGSIPGQGVVGAASGLASNEMAEYQRRFGTSQGTGGLGPLLPVAAGTAAGIITGGTMPAGVRLVTGSPYRGLVEDLGGSVRNPPHLEDAADNLISAVRNTGQRASGLSPDEFNRVAGPNATAQDMSNAILSTDQPRIATRLRDSGQFDDEMDAFAGAHLSNVGRRADWVGLHNRVQESLIPDQAQRDLVHQTFRGPIIPSANFHENLLDLARTADMRLIANVAREVAMQAGSAVGAFAHADPSLVAGMSLLGAAWPRLRDVGGRLFGDPGVRLGAGIGAAVGIPEGASVLSPGGMQFTSSGAPELGAIPYTPPPSYAPPGGQTGQVIPISPAPSQNQLVPPRPREPTIPPIPFIPQ
jgi:hypothetical protein